MVNEFEEQIEYLGENSEKCIAFSEPIKNENKNSNTIKYKTKLIDSVRFMSSLLSSPAENLSKGRHKNKYKT